MSGNYRLDTILVGGICLILALIVPHPLTFIVGFVVTIVYYFLEKRRQG